MYPAWIGMTGVGVFCTVVMIAGIRLRSYAAAVLCGLAAAANFIGALTTV